MSAGVFHHHHYGVFNVLYNETHFYTIAYAVSEARKGKEMCILLSLTVYDTFPFAVTL
jgi:hypothetical protein